MSRDSVPWLHRCSVKQGPIHTRMGLQQMHACHFRDASGHTKHSKPVLGFHRGKLHKCCWIFSCARTENLKYKMTWQFDIWVKNPKSHLSSNPTLVQKSNSDTSRFPAQHHVLHLLTSQLTREVRWLASWHLLVGYHDKGRAGTSATDKCAQLANLHRSESASPAS